MFNIVDDYYEEYVMTPEVEAARKAAQGRKRKEATSEEKMMMTFLDFERNLNQKRDL